jgi:hypothetical protein
MKPLTRKDIKHQKVALPEIARAIENALDLPTARLIHEAKKLADDIAEYAPDTNIELIIRDLIKEIERLQSEKTVAIKSKAKAKAS